MKNKILIVEDDREIARSLAEYLRSESFEVDVAQNAAEFQKLKLNYDLLIMDWMLPDGQGIDLLKQIRAQKQS
ncbi:MAG: response regulator, partial [Bdellovibrionaceae bacterium]|nr:response regulator [Pseudobdellovibrionaceae bacterium]